VLVFPMLEDQGDRAGRARHQQERRASKLPPSAATNFSIDLTAFSRFSGRNRAECVAHHSGEGGVSLGAPSRFRLSILRLGKSGRPHTVGKWEKPVWGLTTRCWLGNSGGWLAQRSANFGLRTADLGAERRSYPQCPTIATAKTGKRTHRRRRCCVTRRATCRAGR
jgi:hypothetical protein